VTDTKFTKVHLLLFADNAYYTLVVSFWSVTAHVERLNFHFLYT